MVWSEESSLCVSKCTGVKRQLRFDFVSAGRPTLSKQSAGASIPAAGEALGQQVLSGAWDYGVIVTGIMALLPHGELLVATWLKESPGQGEQGGNDPG